ncbi:ABC transporter ATP-binding protein [Frankia sp. AiPs1]|uniref:ABC transporter ATP-binding protein n=1 Tax=Frankia sp. AiPs1 TaxID=573493 RepID=UPI002042D59D|nr:ABC transporter ATP-binding protein [Frankia sp. AiPs1]MCM3921578.1 ABC transporter ATP-binding protein [Frankia sp. AiPs1]
MTDPTHTAATASSGTPFLQVRDLTVSFHTDDGVVHAVDKLSFSVERGRTLGIVGESGSGKSVTSLAVMGLHRRGRRVSIAGEIRLDGEDLVTAPAERVRGLRGRRMAMIFQDPLSSMHPQFTVGDQIVEAYRVHNRVSKAAARRRATELLDLVGIPEPARRLDDYPHQFSGGMRQRAMIAMAVSCNPELLIADEPTTALDVTVQAQILDLMRELQKEFNSAIIIITHELGVVAEISHDILVMYAGQAMEYGGVEEVFASAEHPYTWGLLQSITRLDRQLETTLRTIPGSPPSLINVPPGCPFHPRCTYRERAGSATSTTRPPLAETSPGHLVACHLPVAERRRLLREEVIPTL